MANILSNYINKKIGEYINNEIMDVDSRAIIVRDETFYQMQNYAWYFAKNGNELEKFFKENFPSTGVYNNHSFYRSVKGKMPRVHLPVARLITDTITNLIFSEMPSLTVDTGNKKRSEEINKLIDDILNENGKAHLFHTISRDLSYSGACAIKPVIDNDFSDKVILQVYPKESLEIIRKYDRITEIVFKDFYKDNYCLKSHYGKGHIWFELFKNDRKVKLTDLEETSELHDWYFVDSSNKPINKLMAVYITNNDDERSDYDGIYDLLEEIDEIKSTQLFIQRTLKPRRNIPSSLCQLDRATGKAITPDSWDVEDNVVEVEDPENVIRNINEIQFTAPALTVYDDAIKNILKDILNILSLSPSTIGENDGGSNSSSLALNVREKSSLRKRAALITRYDSAFKELLNVILLYQLAQWKKDTAVVQDLDYDYFVDFSEYASPSFDDMVKTLTAALDAGLISQKEAIRELYKDDMSEEKQDEMINEINGKRDELLSKIQLNREDLENNQEESPTDEE